MGRIDLIHIYSIVFPDKYNDKGQRLCRWCGKPVLNRSTRKGRIWYCNDDCYYKTAEALSWDKARRDTFQRDGGKCRICGKDLGKYEENWYTWECHHIKRPHELKMLAWDVTKYIEDRKKQLHWFNKIYAMLYLDINNLMTLCVECHDKVHAADYRNQSRVNPFRVAQTKWGGFWKNIEFNTYQRTLENYSEFPIKRQVEEK